jgi:hypothetical protein
MTVLVRQYASLPRGKQRQKRARMGWHEYKQIIA